MWWNGRFSSWMCSRQICSNCVMLSSQYGLKSLKNVSNTLLNLCHEELRQFWRQKGVQPVTSKVYLIKWPVSVYLKVMWHTAKYGDPYSESMLCIYPSNCTHTAVNTCTPWTHTRCRGQPFILRRPGSSWGFSALLKGTSSLYWRWRD